MARIPVGATIAHAYQFAFRKFFAVLGIVWLPWAILAALGFILRRAGLIVPGAAAHDLPILIPVILVSLLLLLMQLTGITEYALGLKKGPSWFYFSLGKPLWRVAGAILLLLLVVLACILVMIIAGFALAFLARLAHSTTLSVAVLALVWIVSFCAYIFILLRFAFILLPCVVAEARISLERVWTLTEGNFWRLLLICLAVLVPALLIEFFAVFKFLLAGMPAIPRNATPDQLDAYRASLNAWQAVNAARITRYWYLVEPLALAFVTLFYGVSSRAQALAYRALTESEITPNPP